METYEVTQKLLEAKKKKGKRILKIQLHDSRFEPLPFSMLYIFLSSPLPSGEQIH